MLGISMDKILVILVAAVFLLGPERLPRLASQIARIIRRLRELADKTTEQVRRDLGDEYEQIDWRRLDPRQYDPRLIIRNALLEEPPPPRTDGARQDARPDEPAPPVTSVVATDSAERPVSGA